MPMIDATIPAHALSPEAEAHLFKEVTDTVVRIEIGDAENAKAQAASWVFVQRPEVYVGGKAATSPRYRFVISVPEGQFDPVRRQQMVAGITAAVARAENRPLEEVGGRVWVMMQEIPDGSWGARGRVVRLPEILSSFLGEDGHTEAMRRLAARAGWQ
jgi:phenylpyruvate tautomerase PptA (4-oxalocrotonate tautomerase family)